MPIRFQSSKRERAVRDPIRLAAPRLPDETEKTPIYWNPEGWEFRSEEFIEFKGIHRQARWPRQDVMENMSHYCNGPCIMLLDPNSLFFIAKLDVTVPAKGSVCNISLYAPELHVAQWKVIVSKSCDTPCGLAKTLWKIRVIIVMNPCIMLRSQHCQLGR